MRSKNSKSSYMLLFLIFLFACNSKEAIIQFDGEKSYVFKKGVKFPLSFHFKNKGTGDLRIIKAESDCGCTSIQYPLNTIPPNGNGEIKIIYNSVYDKPGTIVKTILIQTNTKPILHVLHVKGVLLPVN